MLHYASFYQSTLFALCIISSEATLFEFCIISSESTLFALCIISSGSKLFAKVKLIFRDRNIIYFENYNLLTPQYIQWAILTLPYQTLWEIPLVDKGLRFVIYFRLTLTNSLFPPNQIEEESVEQND